MNDFGSFIKSIRTKRKLTLVELSILTGVSNPYLSQIENNKFEPSLEVLNKLSVGLNQPLDSLIKGVGYSLQSDSVGEESKDIRLIRHLDRKSTRLNSSHVAISYAVFCLKKKK